MNSLLKNILLTFVFAIWLGFFRSRVSSFLTYLIGWPPFVASSVYTIVAIIVLLEGLAMRKKRKILLKCKKTYLQKN